MFDAIVHLPMLLLQRYPLGLREQASLINLRVDNCRAIPVLLWRFFRFWRGWVIFHPAFHCTCYGCRCWIHLLLNSRDRCCLKHHHQQWVASILPSLLLATTTGQGTEELYVCAQAQQIQEFFFFFQLLRQLHGYCHHPVFPGLPWDQYTSKSTCKKYVFEFTRSVQILWILLASTLVTALSARVWSRYLRKILIKLQDCLSSHFLTARHRSEEMDVKTHKLIPVEQRRNWNLWTTEQFLPVETREATQ